MAELTSAFFFFYLADQSFTSIFRQRVVLKSLSSPVWRKERQSGAACQTCHHLHVSFTTWITRNIPRRIHHLNNRPVTDLNKPPPKTTTVLMGVRDTWRHYVQLLFWSDFNWNTSLFYFIFTYLNCNDSIFYDVACMWSPRKKQHHVHFWLKWLGFDVGLRATQKTKAENCAFLH